MKFLGLVAAVAIASPLFAHAAETNSFYVDGGFGRGISGDHGWHDQSNAGSIAAGYRWSWFGIDAGYVDFSRNSETFYTRQNPDSALQLYQYRSRQHGFTFDGSGRWNLGDRWYYSVRAGLYAWHNAYSANYSDLLPIHTKGSRNGVSWNAGIGLGYDVSKNFSVALRYDLYGGYDGKTMLSLNAEYRF